MLHAIPEETKGAGSSTDSAKPVVVYADANEVSVEAMRVNGLLERLNGFCDFRIHIGVPATPQEFLRIVGNADIVLLGGKIPDLVLERAPRLTLVSYLGQGAANFINLHLAVEKEIAVGVTPDYGVESVSEHALALLFAVARRIPEGDRHLREHRWRPFASGTQLVGRTAAVIGFGKIGARTAHLLSALGMTVLAWTRNPPIEPVPGVKFVPLDEVLDAADVLSLHLALNEETRGFITGHMLDRLAPGAIVINTARAELIEEGALERRLRSGALCAGLDVFTTEPLIPESALLELSNVVLSPHQGYNTPGALASMLTMVVDNVENHTLGVPFHRASS